MAVWVIAVIEKLQCEEWLYDYVQGSWQKVCCKVFESSIKCWHLQSVTRGVTPAWTAQRSTGTFTHFLARLAYFHLPVGSQIRPTQRTHIISPIHFPGSWLILLSSAARMWVSVWPTWLPPPLSFHRISNLHLCGSLQSWFILIKLTCCSCFLICPNAVSQVCHRSSRRNLILIVISVMSKNCTSLILPFHLQGNSCLHGCGPPCLPHLSGWAATKWKVRRYFEG